MRIPIALPVIPLVDRLPANFYCQENRPMNDKIFKAYDVRAIYPNPLNEESAWVIGHATAQYLKRSRQSGTDKVKLEDTMVVSRDMRPSSPSLAKALADGIRSTGMNVIDIGMAD